MKIGILGTSCSGKTTLAKQIAEYYNFELIPEIARNFNQSLLKKDYIQYHILFQQIKEELKDNIVTDRTIIDNYIYLTKVCKPKIHTLKIVRDWSETYDILFLCQKLPFIEDGFREDNNIEPDLIKFMNDNDIKYEIVDGFEKVKNIINRMLNNGMYN